MMAEAEEYGDLLQKHNGKRGLTGVLCDVATELEIINSMLFTLSGSLKGNGDFDSEATVARHAGNKAFQLQKELEVLRDGIVTPLATAGGEA